MEGKKAFYGWPLIVVLGLMYFMSSGFVLSAAQIINPMMMADPNLGMNATILGAGFTLFVWMQGIPSPLVGWLVGKKGAKFTMAIGGVVLFLSALAMIFLVNNAIAYFVVFGVLISVSTIMVGQISVQSTVGQWFAQKRGTAMAITMGIGGLASFAAPLLVHYTINASGGAWQAGWYLLAAFGAISIVFALFFVKNKPSDVGQLPDGGMAAASGDAAKKDKPSRVYKNTGEVTYAQAIRNPNFWLIALAGTGAFCAFSLATSQGVLNFTGLGFSSELVVAAASVMGICSLCGKLFVGLLADFLEPIRIIGVALIVLVVGIVSGALASNEVMVFIYYICTGLGFGTIATNLPTVIANFFGTTAFSKNLSTAMMTTTVFSGLIPIAGGAIYDATGASTVVFVVVAVLVAICCGCSFLVRVPKKQAEEA